MAVWTFARLTLREAARSRLLPIVFLLAAAYVGLIGWGAHLLVQYSSSSASAQASAFGLEVFSVYMVSFVVALIAVFITGASTHSEGESGLLQAMLARPIRRSDLLLGKWVGGAILIAVFIVVLGSGLILAVGLTAGYFPGRPLQAGLLLLIEGLVVLSLRLLFGTFLGNMTSGILPLLLYGLAWMGGLVEVIGQVANIEAMVTAGVATSLLVPTDVLWRGVAYFLAPESTSSFIVQALGRGNPFTSLTPIATPMLVWSCVYVVAAFLPALVVFSRRDV